MFHVRSIYPCQEGIEQSSFDLWPSHPQAQAICDLVEQFLKARPAEFREPLAFLKKGDFELDWSAVSGGVALFSISRGGEPAAVAVLAAGLSPEADRMMLDVFCDSVLTPLFADKYQGAREIGDRPVLLQVIFAGSECASAVGLLNTAIASVYLRNLYAGKEQRCRA